MKYALFLVALVTMHDLRAYEVTDGFLQKIAVIESGENCTAVGDKGASLGRYQMQRSAWVDACRRNNVNWPYGKENAFNYPITHQVCKWHFEWLAQTLEKRKIRVCEMTLYMAYNKGLEGAKRLGYNTQIDDPALNRARNYLNTCQ